MDCSKDLTCLNKDESLRLKIGGIVAILVGSAIGVAIPLVFRNFSRTKLFFGGQCFAAGVILATGFVHILPDAFESLTNECLGDHPWGKFPFTGFIAMTTAMLVLLVDSLAVAFYSHKASLEQQAGGGAGKGDAHAHVHHMHNDGSTIEDGRVHSGDMSSPDNDGSTIEDGRVHSGDMSSPDNDYNSAVHDVKVSDEDNIRNKVVAQVLEFGILAHSVIIGIAMGASESPCTIRPLVGALVFHQLFEGLALGGCISKGEFQRVSKWLMSFFFSVTTPGGIAIGIAIASRYNENDPDSLIIQGVFDAMSAGILIYMALVDLLATQFLSKEFLDKSWMHYSLGYSCLFLGAGAMSVIAVWA